MNSLLTCLATKSLLFAPPDRPFLLASGATSPYYLDCKGVTLDPKSLRLLARVCAERIEQKSWLPMGVGGLTLGADPIAIALSLEGEKRGHPWLPFIVRKETKGRGTHKRVEGNLPVGCDVVVLEDTTTTGGSAMNAVMVLRAEGYQVLGVLTLVDREEGGKERFDKESVPFEALFTLKEVLARSQELH